MITNFFIPELNNHDVQELWFRQDGTTCHTALATIDLLKDTFGDRLISRFGPVNWPPRSCDLTPLDYFLWGYVKSLVYADKPQTLDHLEDNIRRVIADIRPQMLEKVIENWTSRLDYIRASRGSHMPEIIFKMKKIQWCEIWRLWWPKIGPPCSIHRSEYDILNQSRIREAHHAGTNGRKLLLRVCLRGTRLRRHGNLIIPSRILPRAVQAIGMVPAEDPVPEAWGPRILDMALATPLTHTFTDLRA
ncbi:uncharacterized protein TNCV_4350881 [Trichonephila clavipes]|nr:uncharacterized protein TNCV_4350881 [Trichonephila clavipes]